MVDASSALLDRLRGLTLDLAGPGARERLAKLRPAETEYRVDPYGLDIDYALAMAAPFLWLYRKYFRVQVLGLERVPACCSRPARRTGRAARTHTGADRSRSWSCRSPPAWEGSR